MFASFLNFMIIQKSKSLEFFPLLIETFLILGISTAARNGWQVHSYAQDGVAVEEIWPETTRKDPRSVQCCPGTMEQPKNQSVPGQAKAGAQNPGGVSAHHSGMIMKKKHKKIFFLLNYS